jgi:nitrite reductase/ring-hydroxylating ferredoxin subunit
MAGATRLICAAADLVDGGLGVRFATATGDSAFAVRFRGQVYGYINHCPHRGGELDWRPGDFFDAAGLYLICATHGALFCPADGSCVAGPCRGARLRAVVLHERGDRVWLDDETKDL